MAELQETSRVSHASGNVKIPLASPPRDAGRINVEFEHVRDEIYRATPHVPPVTMPDGSPLGLTE